MVEYERNSGQNFFFLFLSLSQPVLAKNNTRKRFFTFFDFFCYFPRNFLARVECEWNSGLNIFSPFLGLSHLVLVRNTAGKMFFNFFNYFDIIFAILFPGPSMNGIRDLNFFFFSFSASLSPFWIEIKPELSFLIF